MDGLMSGHSKGPRLEQWLTVSSVQSCQLMWWYSWITNPWGFLLLQLKTTAQMIRGVLWEHGTLNPWGARS